MNPTDVEDLVPNEICLEGQHLLGKLRSNYKEGRSKYLHIVFIIYSSTDDEQYRIQTDSALGRKFN